MKKIKLLARPDTWRVTCDTWCVTPYTWHVTLGGGWTFCQNFSSLALSVWAGKWCEDLEENADRLTKWINQLFTRLFIEQPRLHRVLLIIVCTSLHCSRLRTRCIVDATGVPWLRLRKPWNPGPTVTWWGASVGKTTREELELMLNDSLN